MLHSTPKTIKNELLCPSLFTLFNTNPVQCFINHILLAKIFSSILLRNVIWTKSFITYVCKVKLLDTMCFMNKKKKMNLDRFCHEFRLLRQTKFCKIIEKIGKIYPFDQFSIFNIKKKKGHTLIFFAIQTIYKFLELKYP